MQRALIEAPADPASRVQILVSLSFAQTNTGQIDAALATIEDSVAEATKLGQSHLLGSALGTRAMVRFMSGAGVDKPRLQHALELEDREANIPLIFRPSLLNALLLAYSGEFDRAHNEMLEVRRRCSEATASLRGTTGSRSTRRRSTNRARRARSSPPSTTPRATSSVIPVPCLSKR